MILIWITVDFALGNINKNQDKKLEEPFPFLSS